MHDPDPRFLAQRRREFHKWLVLLVGEIVPSRVAIDVEWPLPHIPRGPFHHLLKIGEMLLRIGLRPRTEEPYFQSVFREHVEDGRLPGALERPPDLDSVITGCLYLGPIFIQISGKAPVGGHYL